MEHVWAKAESQKKAKKPLPSELKIINGVLLLRNRNGLEESSKHGRGVAGLENA